MSTHYVLNVDHEVFKGLVGPFDSADDAFAWARTAFPVGQGSYNVCPLHSGQGIIA